MPFSGPTRQNSEAVLESRLPPGAAERFVAGCGTLPGCTLLECWRGGALLVDDWSKGRCKAKLELSVEVDAVSLAAEVRGDGEPAGLWRVLALLVGTVEGVLDGLHSAGKPKPPHQSSPALPCPGDDAVRAWVPLRYRLPRRAVR